MSGQHARRHRGIADDPVHVVGDGVVYHLRRPCGRADTQPHGSENVIGDGAMYRGDPIDGTA
ncbi:hypothetical protein [Nocardia elegans]|uniref:hypothetical protein n=1 Tax=Nocardia elegans TaxID=300029 RepID=UPI001E430F55|nr:hypothetical protein [Nocardia elegans]